jgi:hypothetical protein
MNVSSRFRAAGLLAAAIFVGACAGPATTAPSTPSPAGDTPAHGTASPSASLEATPVPSDADGLVLLAGGDVPAILTFDARSGWTKRADVPAATAIAAGQTSVLLANASSIEVRPWPDLSRVERSIALEWQPGTAPAVAAVSASPAGALAFALSLDGRVGFATATSAGVASTIDIPDAQPFTPLVAWMDDARRMVLRTDARQISRLAVTTGPGDYESVAGVEGVRWFAVSADGSTVALATEDTLYVGAVDAVLAGTPPAKLATVAPGSVAWDLALDRSGSRFAFLTGAVAQDGTVSSATEVIYSRRNGAWSKVDEVAAPPGGTLGQAWAN